MRSLFNPFNSFVNSSTTHQEWFTPQLSHDSDSDQPGYPTRLAPPLNLGVLNKFDLDGRKTCTNSEIVFGSEEPYQNRLESYYYATANFWSCVFYPNLTRDYREARMTPAGQNFISDLSVDVSIETARNVTSFLSTCLISYCRDSEACKSASCSVDRLVLAGAASLSATETDQCLRDICEHDPDWTTTQDIAGIGVLTSYSIQVGVALISVILALVLPHLQYVPGMPACRIKETYLVTLDDFQRTQCCFVISVALATVCAFPRMTDTDIAAAGTAMAVGFAPTVTVMTLLMVENKLQHSRFTFWIALLAWMMSCVVSAYANRAFRSGSWKVSLNSGPAVCGEWPPSYICGTKARLKRRNDFPFLLFSLLPFAAILTVTHFIPVKQVRSGLRYIRRIIRQEKFIRLERLPFANRLSRPRKTRAMDTLSRVITAINEVDAKGRVWPAVVGVGGLLICFFALVPILAVSLSKNIFIWQELSDTEWTFGQMMAVTVWLPTILSCINDCICGPLVSRTKQLPRTLKVVRETSSQQDPAAANSAAPSNIVDEGGPRHLATVAVPFARPIIVGTMDSPVAAVRSMSTKRRRRSASF